MTTSPTDLARELCLELLQQGLTPRQLRPGCRDRVELEGQLLEEAMTLRETGEVEGSLWLLDRSLALGFSNPWIHDNRARALVALGERQRARAIWLQLAEQATGALAETGMEMARLQERTLIEALRSINQRHGYHNDKLEEGEPDLLTRVLEELIRTREQNRPLLSLELAEETQRLGWRSPWLLDNQARALVALGRHAEAVTIWQTVAAGEDQIAATAADEMLGIYGGRDPGMPGAGYPDWQIDRERAAQARQLRSEQPGAAEVLLMQALLDLPDPRCCRQLLESWIGEDESADNQFPELKSEAAALRVHERLLDVLEMQVRGATQAEG